MLSVYVSCRQSERNNSTARCRWRSVRSVKGHSSDTQQRSDSNNAIEEGKSEVGTLQEASDTRAVRMP